MVATSTDVEAVKKQIAEEVRRMHPRLIQISQTIHANPEILFEEHEAVKLLTSELDEHGFDVEVGVAGLDTAFVATYGTGGKPVVGILAEYDALPKLGHACGHNLIATWGIGAGIALRRALPDFEGTIKVIGCPAEEGGGGKVIMADAGIFNGLDAVMMMHARDTTYINRNSLARSRYNIEFFGKSAHAAASPEKGISALDGVIQVFNGVNALRQFTKPHTKIHGIVTHGGDAANIVPEYASAIFLVRAKEQDYLEEMKERFVAIVNGAALLTGTTVKITEGIGYKARVCNEALIETFRDNLLDYGLDYAVASEEQGVGSSDIGNVAQVVPTIHPYLQICEPGVGGHTPEFAAASASEWADESTATGSILLAWTAADVLLRPELRERLRETFRRDIGHDPVE